MLRGVAPFECLCEHHLADPDHASPSNIAELILQLGPVADPNYSMEVIIKLLTLLVAILLTQQTGGLGGRLQDNFLPVHEWARRVPHIVSHVSRNFHDGTL